MQFLLHLLLYVPPSPPNVINFVVWSSGIFPLLFNALYAASTPDEFAAAHSNAVCINESVQDVYGYINVETVNVRKETNTSCEILDQLSKNTEVEILEELQGWKKIEEKIY